MQQQQPHGFDAQRERILSSLARGVDLSPKGSIDAPIVSLVQAINAEGTDCVTTSSCSGRIALYETPAMTTTTMTRPLRGDEEARTGELGDEGVEGVGGDNDQDEADSNDGGEAGTGGGAGEDGLMMRNQTRKGIEWILVRHDHVSLEEVEEALRKRYLTESDGIEGVADVSGRDAISEGGEEKGGSREPGQRMVLMVKFEPFIMHMQCRSLEVATRILHAAHSVGYRESGIVPSSERKGKRILMHIRTTALQLECPLIEWGAAGVDREVELESMLRGPQLHLALREANARLALNLQKIERLSARLAVEFEKRRGRLSVPAQPAVRPADVAEHSDGGSHGGGTAALITPARAVKSIKTLLERLALLDKSVRIASCDPAVSEAVWPTLCQSNSGRSINGGGIEIVRHGPIVADGRDVSWGLDGGVGRPALKAVALTTAGTAWIRMHRDALREETKVDGQGEQKDDNELQDEMDVGFTELVRILDGHVVLAQLHGFRESASVMASVYEAARRALSALADTENVPVPSDIPMLPKKLELVGDVLMVSEDMLPSQEAAADGAPPLAPVHGITAILRGVDHPETVWDCLAHSFHASRIAVKATIDAGPMRQSHVRLVHVTEEYEAARAATAADDADGPGWVVVRENGVAFHFDITRVMFCSGNVSERMRMASVCAAGEVVADLYCGIGYYTVPMLVHAGVSHIHAFEWNPDSVAALRRNLQRNHVSDERYTIWFGDNRDVVRSEPVQERVWGTADRVLLGLLPSSEDSWPLAPLLLRREGGTVHVHGNVLDADMSQWREDTVARFAELFDTYHVSCTHCETVKSYSPHVFHYVLDLRIQPNSL